MIDLTCVEFRGKYPLNVVFEDIKIGHWFLYNGLVYIKTGKLESFHISNAKDSEIRKLSFTTQADVKSIKRVEIHYTLEGGDC